jgi:hypothetical protein
VSELVSEADGAPMRMLRQGPWKLYVQDGMPPVMYDLDDDPGELQDLGQSHAHAEIRDALLSRLNDGWDPDFVRRENHVLDVDAAQLAGWGGVVQPRHEDVIPVTERMDVTVA